MTAATKTTATSKGVGKTARKPTQQQGTMATKLATQQGARARASVKAGAVSRESMHSLANVLATRAPRSKRRQRYELVTESGERFDLPEALVRVLETTAQTLAAGHGVEVLPTTRELTTQEAADVLNVSRQYLVRILDDGAIPFRKTGTHRRLQLADVMEYKAKRDETRREALRELTRLSQEFGLYA